MKMKTILAVGFAAMVVAAQAQVSMNVDLLDNWSDSTLGDNGSGATYNETWGFIHNGQEHAVIGSTYGTHIFQITNQDELIELDRVPGRLQGPVVHRHFDNYNGYLYGICQQGGSSLQIMKLSSLPDSVELVYDSDTLFAIAHNIFIDTSSAIMYVAGPQGQAMSLYDLTVPDDPQFILHFNQVPYVHDMFVRNDTAYLNAANDGLFVYDFSTPTSPVLLGSLTTYPDQGYNHSGWLSEDGNRYVMADETLGMRMKVVDVSDLTDITPQGLFNSGVDSLTVPHNLMLRENITYVSHYNDGLRIFDVSNPNNPLQIGYYDTHLTPDTASRFRGAWGVYALFPSERILISDRQSGLYLFRFNNPNSVQEQVAGTGFAISPNPSNGNIQLNLGEALRGADLTLFDAQGKLVLRLDNLPNGSLALRLPDLAKGQYVMKVGTAVQRVQIY